MNNYQEYIALFLPKFSLISTVNYVLKMPSHKKQCKTGSRASLVIHITVNLNAELDVRRTCDEELESLEGVKRFVTNDHHYVKHLSLKTNTIVYIAINLLSLLKLNT